jgi:hypothetical protein
MSELNDREKILAAIGGRKGLIDSGLPSLLFLISFNFTKEVRSSAYLALALSLILTIIRLARRETIQHSISGVLGVAICAWLSNRTGKAEDFYLPGLWTNVIYGIAYALSNLIGWPIIGVIIGPLVGENFRWRKNLSRRRMYIKATWLWVALFISRLAVQYPLYRSGNINLLGTARLVMGYPLFLLTAWGTWLIIKSGPAPDNEEKN